MEEKFPLQNLYWGACYTTAGILNPNLGDTLYTERKRILVKGWECYNIDNIQHLKSVIAQK